MMKESRMELIWYIMRKRKITDPIWEAELMERYYSRYGTYQPPQKHLPVTYDKIACRKTLLVDEVLTIAEELGISRMELAEAAGMGSVDELESYRVPGSFNDPHFQRIKKLLLERIKERDMKSQRSKVTKPVV